MEEKIYFSFELGIDIKVTFKKFRFYMSENYQSKVCKIKYFIMN